MAKQAEKSKEKTTKEAQKTAPKVQETPTEAGTEAVSGVVETPPEANEAAPETPPESPETQEQYAFPRENPCPRCQAMDTVATSTQGQVQYRRCTRAICRENFKVIGQKIVFTDCKQAD